MEQERRAKAALGCKPSSESAMTGEPVRLFLHLGAAELFVLLGIPLARNRIDPEHWLVFGIGRRCRRFHRMVSRR